jgi:hypothetical protein
MKSNAARKLLLSSGGTVRACTARIATQLRFSARENQPGLAAWCLAIQLDI